MVVFELMSRGGPMMWVLLSISVVGTAISLERILALFGAAMLNSDKFLRRVLSLVEEGQLAQALEACNVRSRHPLPRVLKAGLSKANRREKEVEKAMEAQLLNALPQMQRGISFLGLLGNVSTLLGLLGTIFGLIQAFEGVSAASAAQRQQVLADGISVAMYTTAFGLIVAVPILFAHTIISSRMEKILIQAEEGAVSLLGTLGGSRARMGARQQDVA